ncbi:MAG: OmpA family protein, partial [Sulfurimonadaceae bacterium]|nr:OmpA family protein [Sulfurimonadaceae bacterium]
MKKTIMISSLVVAALLTTGCVSKQTHEAALQELDQTRSSLSSAEQKISEQNSQIEMNRAEITRTQNELADLDQQKALLQNELENARTELGAFKSQLETMRQIEAETKKRNEIYARFVKELQKMIDGGQLTVSIEEGRIVINLPDNVLFASGSAKVNEQGREALKQIASVLKAFDERRFQVEGHTDNVPIKGSSGYSNWELSAERALSVV